MPKLSKPLHPCPSQGCTCALESKRAKETSGHSEEWDSKVPFALTFSVKRPPPSPTARACIRVADIEDDGDEPEQVSPEKLSFMGKLQKATGVVLAAPTYGPGIRPLLLVHAG